MKVRGLTTWVTEGCLEAQPRRRRPGLKISLSCGDETLKAAGFTASPFFYYKVLDSLRDFWKVHWLMSIAAADRFSIGMFVASFLLVHAPFRDHQQTFSCGVNQFFHLLHVFSTGYIFMHGGSCRSSNRQIKRVYQCFQGVTFKSKIEDFPEEKWNTIIAVNLSAPFHLIKRSLPGMKKKGECILLAPHACIYDEQQSI
jgi:hypothetical protein